MRLWRLNRIVLLDRCFCFFFFNDTATTEIYTLSLHDALPILLAERPVKVGDWVVLGDTEGDVRRVNVRATEIQLGDRSTVIVPNSEFITKTVRNMTLAGAPGRVLLRLPAPLDTDAERMRTR